MDKHQIVLVKPRNKELQQLLTRNVQWDICFTKSSYNFFIMNQAIELVRSANLLDCIAFPKSSSLKDKKPLQLNFFNTMVSFNIEQKQAVEAIVVGSSGPSPVGNC